MSGSRMDLLDRFSEKMAADLLNRSESPGQDVWPQPLFHPMEAVHFGSEEILEYLRVVLAGNLPERTRAVARLVPFPSALAHFGYLFLEKPARDEDVRHRAETAYRLLLVISMLRHGDPFCDSGRNVLWADKEVTQRLSTLELLPIEGQPGSYKLAAVVAKMCVALMNYSEFAYFSNITFSREIHGPYPLGTGEVALVRDYHDLRPPFWQFARKLPFRKVRIVTMHSHLSAQADFSGRIRIAEPLAQSMRSACIEIDGEAIDLHTRTPEALAFVKSALLSATSEVKSKPREELIALYLEGFGEVLAPLGLPGADGPRRISPSLRCRIRAGRDKPDAMPVFANLPKATPFQAIEALKILFDPRTTRGDVRRLVANVATWTG